MKTGTNANKGSGRIVNRWNNWETIYPEISFTASTGDNVTGEYNIPYAQDWYLVWYNSGASPVNIDYSVEYTAEGAFDFSNADVAYENVYFVEQATYIVPSSGDWYFFVYFDPFVNPDPSVDITFDVSYNTDVTYADKWIDFSPVLLIIGFIIVVLLVIAIIQRRTVKETPSVAPTTPAAAIPEVSTAPSTSVQAEEPKNCHRCKTPSKPGDVYCTNCGAKLTGRDYGVSKISTPASAKNCHSCGKPIIPESRYCKYCGVKIEQKTQPYKYFPDEREAFFCQLDNEKHPSTDSAYECEQCSRKICGNCYNSISQTGVTKCPYCKGELLQVQ